MKLNKFNTISKVELINNTNTRKTLYYGSSKELLDLTEFNEYGWKYIVEKIGLNNEDPLNYIDDNTKEITIGFNVNDIMKVRDTLFPTRFSCETINPSNINYFSSVIINKQRLYIIPIEKGYDSVELFDENNKSIGNISLNSKLYKILWIVVTPGGVNSVEDINISYYSWINDINPYRNLDNYLVPKINSLDISVCSYENGEYRDNSSNTLLGNKEITKPIEFNLIIDYAEKHLYNNNIILWNKQINFQKNQKTSYDGKVWISLCNNNIGEVPTFSNNWILNKLDLIKKETTNENIEKIETEQSLPPIINKIENPIEEKKVTLVNYLGFIVDTTVSSTFIYLKSREGILNSFYFNIIGEDKKQITLDNNSSYEDINSKLIFNKTDDILSIDCRKITTDLKIEVWK